MTEQQILREIQDLLFKCEQNLTSSIVLLGSVRNEEDAPNMAWFGLQTELEQLQYRTTAARAYVRQER